MIGEGEKKYYVLINDFNRSMYDHSLHRGKKHFCCYCFHAFITEETLKRHIKKWFKINVKQTIKMPKKYEYFKFKNFERKMKSPFMIYADFVIILVPEDNTNKSHTSKYQQHVACSYDYKLLCVDDKFSKPLKSCLIKDTVYNSISSMIEEINIVVM